MWSVNINGAWHPARSERQILNWLRDGHVNLQTLVHRQEWPTPIPLAEVPELQALLAQDERAKQLNSKLAKIAGWGVAEFVTFLMFCGIAASGRPATIAISVVLGATVSLVLIGRFIAGVPRILKYSAFLLWDQPYLSVSWGLVLALAAACGWIVQFNRVAECQGVAEQASALTAKKWPSTADEDFQEIDRLTGVFEQGEETCKRLGMREQVGVLENGKGALAFARAEVTKMVDAERNRLAAEAQKEQQALAIQARAQEAAASAAKQEEARANMITESCFELSTEFGTGSSLSDLQKDEAWPRYKGRQFEWQLRITDVRSGILGGYTVQAKCTPQSPSLVLDIQLSYDSDAKEYVSRFNKDSVYKVKGTLTHTSTLFGLGADGIAP